MNAHPKYAFSMFNHVVTCTETVDTFFSKCFGNLFQVRKCVDYFKALKELTYLNKLRLLIILLSICR